MKNNSNNDYYDIEKMFLPKGEVMLIKRSYWLAFKCIATCRKSLNYSTGHFLIESHLNSDRERKMLYEATMLSLSNALQELKVVFNSVFTSKDYREIDDLWTKCSVSSLEAVCSYFKEVDFDQAAGLCAAYHCCDEESSDVISKEELYARKVGEIYNVVDADKVMTNARNNISNIGIALLEDAYSNMMQKDINEYVKVVFDALGVSNKTEL